MWTAQFWLQALERAAKTAAQFVIGGLTLGEGVDAFSVDWRLGLGFAGTGFVLSLLTSVASVPVTGTPSLVREHQPK